MHVRFGLETQTRYKSTGRVRDVLLRISQGRNGETGGELHLPGCSHENWP